MSVSKEASKLIQKIVLVLLILGCTEALAQPEEATKAVTMILGEQGPDGCELLGRVKVSSKESESE